MLTRLPLQLDTTVDSPPESVGEVPQDFDSVGNPVWYGWSVSYTPRDPTLEPTLSREVVSVRDIPLTPDSRRASCQPPYSGNQVFLLDPPHSDSGCVGSTLSVTSLTEPNSSEASSRTPSLNLHPSLKSSTRVSPSCSLTLLLSPFLFLYYLPRNNSFRWDTLTLLT